MSMQQPSRHFVRQAKRIRWQIGASKSTAALIAHLAYGGRS